MESKRKSFQAEMTNHDVEIVPRQENTLAQMKSLQASKN